MTPIPPRPSISSIPRPANVPCWLLDDGLPHWSHDRTRIVTFGFKEIDPKTGSIDSYRIDGLDDEAGTPSLTPDNRYLLFETSDSERYAGYARALLASDPSTADTPNPVVPMTQRLAFEPRISPVPVPAK